MTRNQQWAVVPFLLALWAGFGLGQALSSSVPISGLASVVFLIEVIACLLWLLYLRGKEQRENTWCEARR